jgi:tripartite ATP-independent transporter DctM subunit
MEWWLFLIMIFSILIFLFLTRVPVAFSFLLINIVGFFLFMGGKAGLNQLILSIYESVTTFVLLPIPLFIMMGDLMFRTGVAPRMIEALDMWLGRVPGRLSLLTVFGGAVFGAVSGASMASVAMLGSVVLPQMQERGYKHPMSLGPILGSAGLDILIPPSALGVVLAALGRFSVGKFLVAITIPGILLAVLYAAYVIVRCRLQPSLAPAYESTAAPLSKKINATLYYVLPLGSVFFLAIGLIFLGVATPSEAAALGALGCFGLALFYRSLSWKVFNESVGSVLRVTVMIFMIIAGATAFSQILAFSGATVELVKLSERFPLPPMLILVLMQLIVLIMGCFMEAISIIMVTIPIFMPIIKTLGFDPIWFGAIMLLNLQVGGISPPFGLTLFVLKGVAPGHITMGDIYAAAYPFIALDILMMAIMMAVPQITLWAPSLMK